MIDGRANVHPALLRRMGDQERLDGIDLRKIPQGGRVMFETRNSVYKAERQEDRVWLLTGGTRWTTPTKVYLCGSTWGGSVLKPDWIGEGMHVEFYDIERQKTVTTSSVINMSED